MKRGIALAGNLIVDKIKYIEQYPAKHALTTILNETSSPGGLVCNCTICLAKMDPELPLKAVGIVGSDPMGDYIVNKLADFPSVDTSGVVRAGHTSYTDVMTEPGGGRTFFQYRGANALLAPAHIDISGLQADILHIGYILLLDALDAPDPEYPTAMCRVLADARKAGIATSIDVVSEDSLRFAQLVTPVLRFTDYCIINEFEAERTTGIRLRDTTGGVMVDNLRPACEELISMGVSRWAVIHMPELSCGLAGDGEYVQMDSWKIPADFKKSSVGAGDAFASGILYGAYQGWDLERSIYAAGAVAAWSLSGAGAADAILPLQNLLEKMEYYQNSLRA